MVTIELHDLILHGYHGVHAEEWEVMNSFEVNLDVTYDEKQTSFQHLDDTISYVSLYEIVKERIQIRSYLLEKIAQEILAAIKDRFPQVMELRISIHKLFAPIENFQGKVGVSITKKF